MEKKIFYAHAVINLNEQHLLNAEYHSTINTDDESHIDLER